ncbi:MAG: hypothetical protein ABJL33_00800 [Hyphomicrobiales bacterium]
MALASYIQRRDGRYYLQIRLAPKLSQMLDRSIYRKSLRTSKYVVAQHRLRECLGWIYKLNESIDYPHLIKQNLRLLQDYIKDSWPLSDERLFSRRAYEEMFKNFKHRSIAAGYDPAIIAPEINKLFSVFVQQNADAEAHQRNIINQQHYERGRQDAAASILRSNAPSSFQLEIPVIQVVRSEDFEPPTLLVREGATETNSVSSPVLNAPTANLPEQLVQPKETAAALIPQNTGPNENTRFSEALELYLDETPGSKDTNAATRLIFSFLIEKMGNPVVAEFGPEAVKKFDSMMPDIPNRTGIPREHTKSLAARLSVIRVFGTDGFVI